MQVLKENKILVKYIFPILSIPFISLVLNELITFIFQIGKYYGTFIRGLYEIVLSFL